MKTPKPLNFDNFYKEQFEMYQLDNILQREILKSHFPNPQPTFFVIKELFDIGIIKGNPLPEHHYTLGAIINGNGFLVKLSPKELPPINDGVVTTAFTMYYEDFALHIISIHNSTFLTKQELKKRK